MDAAIITSVYWYDRRLTWNPTDFNDIKTIRVQENEIWVPDLNVVNRLWEITKEKVPKVKINYQGAIQYTRHERIRAIFSPDITNFPYDGQYTQLRIASMDNSDKTVQILTRRWDIVNKIDDGIDQSVDRKGDLEKFKHERLLQVILEVT